MPTIDMQYGNANFTELFSTYLNSYNLPSTLDIMPEDDSGITFKQRFIDRNYYKEIGSETEELFTMHLAIKCQECVNKYFWKINEYTSQRDNFMNRVEKLNEQFTDTEGGSDTNQETGTRKLTNSGTDNNTYNEYYNPQNSSSDNLVNKNTNTTAYGKSSTETPDITLTNKYGKTVTKEGYREHLMYFSKSYPELMELVQKINILYEEALEFLDVLFMGVL